VTALGWYATKHSVGVYGSAPARRPWGRDLSTIQSEIDATALNAPLLEHDGDLKVEAFVIRHQRDGAPRSGVVLGRTASGARALAAIDTGAPQLEELEREEIVGTRWRCRHHSTSGTNLARPG
jgi:acetyl-CoA C-acetyltransferase